MERQDNQGNGRRVGKALCLLLLVGILGCVAMGCSLDYTREGSVRTVHEVPYASQDELENLAMVDGTVDYRVARVLGAVEMQAFLDTCGWSPSAVLSERPVVIYDVSGNQPLYYEFHVIDNGEDMGFVTCVAQKADGDPVKFISKERQEYLLEPSIARSLESSDGKAHVYDVGYPRVMPSRLDAARSITPPDDEMSFDEWLAQLTDEELAAGGRTRDELKSEYDGLEDEEASRLEALWKEIDAAKDQLLEVTDEDIILASMDRAIGDRMTIEHYVIPQFDNIFFDQVGYYDIYCAPALLAEILFGYQVQTNRYEANDYTKGKEIRDAVKDYLGTGAKYFFGMDDTIRRFSSDELKLGFHFLHLWDHIVKDLKDNDLPVISLRSGRNCVFEAWHYRGIIGAKEFRIELKDGRFLWWTWKRYENNKYYYMMDNGADAYQKSDDSDAGESPKDTLKFWEKAGKRYLFQHFSVERI